MWTLPSRSDPKLNRHHCCECGKDLTNKLSIGGLRGNWCIGCYCKSATIDKERFLKAIENRRCCRCDLEYDRNLAITEIRMDEIPDERQRDLEYGRDLAIKPAIIQFENGKFQGLLCFPCRYRLDEKNDLANKKKFEAEKQLYEERYAEWRSRCNKEYEEWESQCKKNYAKWKSQYGEQWEAQQKKAKKSDETNFLIGGFASVVAVVTFLIIAYLVFDSSSKWDSQARFVAAFFAATVGASVACALAKEAASGLFNKPAVSSIPPPPEMSLVGENPPPNPSPQPRPEPKPPEIHALCGYPDLLFDCNKEADLDPNFVNYYPLELFPDDPESRNPPDWEERSKRCKQRDGNYCVLCKEKKNLVAHHIIPKSEGGSHSLQNLTTLCQFHHYGQKYYGHDEKIEQGRGTRIYDNGHSRMTVKFAPKKTRKTPHAESGNQLRFNFGGVENPMRNHGETSH